MGGTLLPGVLCSTAVQTRTPQASLIKAASVACTDLTVALVWPSLMYVTHVHTFVSGTATKLVV